MLRQSNANSKTDSPSPIKSPSFNDDPLNSLLNEHNEIVASLNALANPMALGHANRAIISSVISNEEAPPSETFFIWAMPSSPKQSSPQLSIQFNAKGYRVTSGLCLPIKRPSPEPSLPDNDSDEGDRAESFASRTSSEEKNTSSRPSQTGLFSPKKASRIKQLDLKDSQHIPQIERNRL
jgi:hypothetical protein